jgi:hypothetical protein
LTYGAAFAAAMAAAHVELWWLLPPAALAGGLGYTVGGQRWLRAYRADPTAYGRAVAISWVALVAVLATVALVVLVARA